MAEATVEPRILLVDDEPVLLSLMTRMLEGEGYRVTAVMTGEAALGWLTEHAGSEVVVADATVPFAVVSDVRLPEMNGCSLGREIVQRWPGTKLLFISGYVPAALFAMRICPGDIPILPKPFQMEEFVEAVRQTLEGPPWAPEDWPEPEGDF